MSDSGSIITQIKVPSERETFTLHIPRGATFLHLNTDRGRAIMWVALGPAEEKIPVQFYVFEDEKRIPESLVNTTAYLATFFETEHEGSAAKHLFFQYDPENPWWTLAAIVGKVLAPDNEDEKSVKTADSGD